MKQISQAVIRYTSLVVALLLLAGNLSAQTPSITAIIPTVAQVGDTVTITGTNFNDTADKNIVFFGATKGHVVAASSTLLKAIVDTGTTNYEVSVVNLTTGLYAQSSRRLSTSYKNSWFLNNTFNFKPGVNFSPGGSSPYSLSIADLDSDGKADVVVNNKGASSTGNIVVFQNKSVPGRIDDTSLQIVATLGGTLSSPTNVKTIDLNGDGKKDIIFTQRATPTQGIGVYLNTSTPGHISFGSLNVLSVLPYYGAEIVQGADFDNDGKADIALTLSLTDRILIFRNTTIGTSLSFDTFSVATGAHPIGLAAGDLNGDRKVDLVSVDTGSHRLSILRNTSTPGSLSFSADTLPTMYGGLDVHLFDADNDTLLDIVMTRRDLGNDTVSIFRNTTSSVGGSLTFAAEFSLKTSNAGAGMASGDINGDGKPELAVCTFLSGIEILRNNGSPGTLISTSLTDSIFLSRGGYINTEIADMDGDMYPDVIGVYPAITGGPMVLTVFRNYPLPNAGTITGDTALCFSGSTALMRNSISRNIYRPLQNTDTTGGYWSLTNTSLASINDTGLVTGISPGLDTVVFMKVAGGDTNYAYKVIRIDSIARVSVIGGPSSICLSTNATLTDSAAGGRWSSASPSVVSVNSITGVARGVSLGLTSIKYKLANTCNADSTSKVIRVVSTAISTPLRGRDTVCTGFTITLSDTTRRSDTGTVTWSSSATGVATVSSSGVVFGLSPGSATITFVYSNACGSSTQTKNIIVNSGASVSAISGASAVCQNDTTRFTDLATGGTWSSSNASVATINTTTGLVTGLRAGSTIISYTLSNSCGTATDTALLTVNPLPTAGVISGVNAVCGTGLTRTLTTTGSGGTWSTSAASIASVNASGTVFSVSAGLAIISYTVTNSCGSAVDTLMFDVQAAAVAGTLSGPVTVCQGDSVNWSATSPGGTWRSANTATATTTASGGIYGINAGTVTIVYKVTNTCSSDSVSRSITVNPRAAVGNITGSRTTCIGSSVTLTDTPATGTWSTTSTSIVSLSSTGVVTGRRAGTAIITFSLTTCGTALDTFLITIDSPVAAISAIPVVCLGDTLTVTGNPAGGVFSSGSTSVATISGTGTITTLSTGTAVVSYTYTNACGANVAFDTLVVNTIPAAGSITGANVGCQGSSFSLSATPPGGAWSSGNPSIASVNTSGSVFGSSTGSAVISYTLTNACGSATDTMAVTIRSVRSSGTITGSDTVCTANTITLSSTIAGGTWTSADPTIATIDTTGVVTGLSAGRATISYTVADLCSTGPATFRVNVLAPPTTPTISGSTNICTGGTTTVTPSTTGGIWSLMSDNTTGTVSGSGFRITGVSPGTDTLTYIVTNRCGTATSAPVMVNVVLTADAGTISGAGVICQYTTDTLANTGATGTGTWRVSPASVATVNATTGVVYGVSGGSATVSYIVNSSCGADTAYFGLFVNLAPDAGILTGRDTFCAGSTVTLNASGTGDYWAVSDTSIVNFSSTTASVAVVNGLTAAIAEVYYIDTNGCGRDTAVRRLFVKPPPPVVAPISGPSSICLGASILYTDSTTGGVWQSSNTATASVSTGGGVYAVTAGSITLSYSVTNACTTTTVTVPVLVSAYPRFTSPVLVNGCDSALLTYTPASDSSRATFAWTRAAVAGISNTSNTGTGVVNEYLNNTTVAPVNAVYVYTTTVNGCSTTTNVTATVNPGVSLTGSRFVQVCSGSEFYYVATPSTGAGTLYSWTRPAVTGITPASTLGAGNIIDTLVNGLSGTVRVAYIYTFTLNGCTSVDTLHVDVFPAAAKPRITTHSPISVCDNTMFQNFGTQSAPPAGVTYYWSTSAGASIYATGANQQYCLINFETPGMTWVRLTTSLSGSSCPSGDSLLFNIAPKENHTTTVTTFNGDLVCRMSDADSYQWGYDDKVTLDSTILTGQTNQNLHDSLDLLHRYYWVITTKGGCEQKTYFNAPVGVQVVTPGAGDAGFQLSPNPAKGYFNVLVTSTTTGKASIQLINAMGQVVLDNTINTNSRERVDAPLAAGVYQVRIVAGGEILRGAVVILE